MGSHNRRQIVFSLYSRVIVVDCGNYNPFARTRSRGSACRWPDIVLYLVAEGTVLKALAGLSIIFTYRYGRCKVPNYWRNSTNCQFANDIYPNRASRERTSASHSCTCQRTNSIPSSPKNSLTST